MKWIPGFIVFVFMIILACGPEEDDPNGDTGFTAIFNSDYFQQCKDCHAPGAIGFVDGTEATQDWSTVNSAFSSLQGNASGLIGNLEDCNGVPLLGDTPESSLLVAIFDEQIRTSFDLPAFPNCDVDTIIDKAATLAPIPPALLVDLKAWIDSGTPAP